MCDKIQICPEMQVNEIHGVYDKHHNVSSFLKSHQNTYGCRIVAIFNSIILHSIIHICIQ